MAKTSHTYQSILRDLKAKKYAPVYVLYGEESFFIDKVTHYIEHHVLNEGERGFNQSVFYGKDIDTKTLSAAARRFPMMSTHQVIIVKEAQNLKQLDDLISYLEHPLDSTILVLCIKGKGPDKRTKVGKLLDEQVAMESKRLYENQVPAWIEAYLSEKDLRCDQRGLLLIAESLGADLGRIANELDKVILNLDGRTNITEKEISDSIGISRDFNVFELQAALARKDFHKCILILNYFRDSKNAFGKPVVLLGSLFSWFSKLILIHSLGAQDERNLASAIGVNPYFVKDYLLAARNYPPGKLERIIGLMLDTDLKSKGIGGGSADEDALLKEMFLKIMAAA